MRYFYVSYAFATSDGKSGFGSIQCWEETKYPSKELIKQSALDETPNLIALTILNIIEFKNEQDYNDFVK